MILRHTQRNETEWDRKSSRARHGTIIRLHTTALVFIAFNIRLTRPDDIMDEFIVPFNSFQSTEVPRWTTLPLLNWFTALIFSKYTEISNEHRKSWQTLHLTNSSRSLVEDSTPSLLTLSRSSSSRRHCCDSLIFIRTALQVDLPLHKSYSIRLQTRLGKRQAPIRLNCKGAVFVNFKKL